MKVIQAPQSWSSRATTQQHFLLIGIVREGQTKHSWNIVTFYPPVFTTISEPIKFLMNYFVPFPNSHQKKKKKSLRWDTLWLQLLWGLEKIIFCLNFHNFLKNPRARYSYETWPAHEQNVSSLDTGKISSLRIPY